MSQVLAMIIAQFSDTRIATKSPAGYEPVEKNVVRERLHLALRYIVKLFPSCQQIVLRHVETHFPASEESTEMHMEYVDNLLLLRGYTSLGRDILELITTKCCELDIEMQLDLEDDNDDTVREIMQDLRTENERKDEENDLAYGDDKAEDSDSDEDDSDLESVMSDDSDIKDLKRLAKIRTKIQSMDAILDKLFDLYSQELADPGSDRAAACFEEILADFVNIILVRYKSRHSQFIIFWAAQKCSDFSSRFIGALLDIITGDESRTALVKRTAVSFLAGFVSRAAQVTPEEVQTVVACLLNYIDYYRMKYEPNCQGPDLTRYPVFYALFQGLLYTFCFRWRDLVTEGPDVDRDDLVSWQNSELSWIGGLQRSLKASVHSKLNPLKVCAPGIVQEFAKLAHALNLIYVYPRIELNKSISMSSMSLSAYGAGTALRETVDQRTDERWAPLQAEFPFDPYQLPLSRRWLDKENLYLSWDSIPKPGSRMMEDDSDTDESDEDDEDEVDEDIGPEESD
jgi:RNA polymerase I-specific transcription initiation factor RRN3